MHADPFWEKRQSIRGVYVITDRYINPSVDHITIAKAAIDGGACAVQLRDKRATTRELTEWALKLRRLTEGTKTLLIINDRVDVALACGADGVHLGDDDMPLEIARKLIGKGMLIGRSVDNVQQAIEAEREGADYVSIGAVFTTATKPDAAQAVGVETVRAVKMAVSIPVVAIGGITIANALCVFKAGADAIAVISVVAESDNPLEAVRELVRIYERHRRC